MSTDNCLMLVLHPSPVTDPDHHKPVKLQASVVIRGEWSMMRISGNTTPLAAGPASSMNFLFAIPVSMNEHKSTNHDPTRGQKLLRLGDGVLAVMEDACRQNRVTARLLYGFGEMLEITGPAAGDDGY